MFSLGFKRLHHVCDNVIIRNLRTRKTSLPKNPGLQNRIDAFRKEGLKIEDNDAEEFVEQSDSDLYKAGEAYSQHLNETLIGKYELRHHIIKEKYFKENMPNLLTWSEKEQIRHLYTTNPEEWTPEKLAESFPVTVPVVKKLLKYAWKPATEQRIVRHDQSAMRNWRELKEGTLDIPEELRQHFLKFSERTIPPLQNRVTKTIVEKKENLGEFERIIQRCAAKEENANDSSDSMLTKHVTETKQNYKNPKDSKLITLDALTANIKRQLEEGNELNTPDKIIYDSINSTTVAANVKEVKNGIELANRDSQGTQLKEFSDTDKKVTNITSYPERIRIPKKAYKKGATYKVNDCYYDHDGKFLYRVLGMSNA